MTEWYCLRCGKIFKEEQLVDPDNSMNLIHCDVCDSPAFQPLSDITRLLRDEIASSWAQRMVEEKGRK